MWQELSEKLIVPLMDTKARVFSVLELITPFSTVFSLLLITGIVYCFLRIERNIGETYHTDTRHSKGHGHGGKKGAAEHSENVSNKRWERILDRLDSPKESDWRLAVLEADVLLDEMVTHMGYHGDSLGERLRSVEKSDFVTLDKAWEAHAVRNKIAHEGSAFPLANREAKRVIGLYEEVFREFHYI
ncbi:MAG: hypothetical protein A2W52_02210 [Candidatus Taylorbacteria bacterium RIFCSPHIGHO2_02_49_25]|uniref:Uncharacterized protein n=1 Tax=Candidatus Taylorbacteria bacterium RIFCSPHIGHO2_02_49_25 TaxID=1802305 RepID=A0A1G2MFH0_9BACT|nr:MAG: hypothetical protein A2759_01335 [Candidatus Taylorbacteria bacterium RIFCSPHIGHO2_01_FULL_49_60]OHA21752.1 MAG: hypothetical protein A2W52_02210 [Candidatus Taylorbacteria bacterium RIFCSPHIGHO2_02_49_25]OHA35450.1 MAG: hypothetical protein A2W65_00325 [Candidatus Taylorbacteria bacterium RIFCSPLOWO2_02_50_13]OHA36184.1 MAG: hypothetical protein A3B27_03230 [Candidatus Taylorbacteria bacterium RIFCSPLOWO2_01_FULL_50_130]OHA46076.1 MAG: hypothetical protein A3G61_03870 [Candidatus Taylo